MSLLASTGADGRIGGASHLCTRRLVNFRKQLELEGKDKPPGKRTTITAVQLLGCGMNWGILWLGRHL